MALTAYERETIVSMCDGDDLANVYTAQRTVITKLKKNPAARLLEEGRFEGSAWARFEIPKGLVSFRTKSRVGTPSGGRRFARKDERVLANPEI